MFDYIYSLSPHVLQLFSLDVSGSARMYSPWDYINSNLVGRNILSVHPEILPI